MSITLSDLCERFCSFKQRMAELEEIDPRTAADYGAMTERLMKIVPGWRTVDTLCSEDFWAFRTECSKTWCAQTLGVELARVRTLLRWAGKKRLLELAPDIEDAIRSPSKKTLRKEKSAKGLRMFTADQLRATIQAAGPVGKAMTLLGANCGIGPTDIARMPQSAIQGDWLDYPRGKTGIQRRIPLWPETLAALKDVLATRPADPAALVFVTATGKPWADGKRNSICDAFGRLMKALGIRRSFYDLRRGLATIGSELGDDSAVKAILGHADSSMLGQYRQRFDDARLRKVTDHVRQWLWPNLCTPSKC